jgi:hypothetical protein
MKRAAAAVAAGIIAALVCFPIAAFAAYPPGTFPGAAPGGAFRTVVMSRVLCAAGGSLQASYDRSALILQVPTGAFKSCSQVSIYAAETAVISPLLPAGTLLVDAFAVGWDGSGPAAKPLTLAIDDTAISADATVFETTTTGIAKLTNVEIRAGAVISSFTSPPGYVVTVTAATATPRPTPQAAAVQASGASSPPSPVAASPSSTSDSTPLFVTFVLLGLIVVAGLALVRYRRF